MAIERDEDRIAGVLEDIGMEGSDAPPAEDVAVSDDEVMEESPSDLGKDEEVDSSVAESEEAPEPEAATEEAPSEVVESASDVPYDTYKTLYEEHGTQSKTIEDLRLKLEGMESQQQSFQGRFFQQQAPAPAPAAEPEEAPWYEEVIADADEYSDKHELGIALHAQAQDQRIMRMQADQWVGLKRGEINSAIAANPSLASEYTDPDQGLDKVLWAALSKDTTIDVMAYTRQQALQVDAFKRQVIEQYEAGRGGQATSSAPSLAVVPDAGLPRQAPAPRAPSAPAPRRSDSTVSVESPRDWGSASEQARLDIEAMLH